MPQVYTNITFNDFLQKVSPNTTLHKRDVIGGEILNNFLTNLMLSGLHEICAERFGTGYRASSARCHKYNARKLTCRNPVLSGYPQMSRGCGQGWICEEFNAHNFDSSIVKFAQCVPRVNVNQRQDIGTEVQYEGQWISSPGTHDFFAEAASALNLQWDYVSNSFLSSNFGNTWTCTACPAGTLKMAHSNSPATAGVFYTGMSFR
jgi:hypothetical protein